MEVSLTFAHREFDVEFIHHACKILSLYEKALPTPSTGAGKISQPDALKFFVCLNPRWVTNLFGIFHNHVNLIQQLFSHSYIDHIDDIGVTQRPKNRYLSKSGDGYAVVALFSRHANLFKSNDLRCLIGAGPIYNAVR